MTYDLSTSSFQIKNNWSTTLTVVGVVGWFYYFPETHCFFFTRRDHESYIPFLLVIFCFGAKDIMVGGLDKLGRAHPHLVPTRGQHPTNQLKPFYINNKKVAPILGRVSRYYTEFNRFLMSNYPENPESVLYHLWATPKKAIAATLHQQQSRLFCYANKT